MQINPFVKFGGLELFGVIERARGKAATEAATRTVNQQAVDVMYRFAGDTRLRDSPSRVRRSTRSSFGSCPTA